MATITRTVSSDGAISGTWSYGGLATSVLDGLVTSGDDKYAESVTSSGARYFEFSAFDVPVGSSISSVVIEVQFGGDNSTQSCSLQTALYIGTTYYDNAWEGTQTATVSAPTSYQTRSYTWSTDPSTGSAWTVSGVNGFTRFRITTPDANPDVFIDYAGITVTYTQNANVSRSDTLTLSDSVNVEAPGGPPDVSTSDTLVTTDTANVVLSTRNVSVADTLVTTDTATAARELVVVVSDTLVITDTTDAQRDKYVAKIDTVHFSSSVTVERETAVAPAEVTPTDTLVVTDATQVERDKYVAKIDTVYLSSSVTVARQLAQSVSDTLVVTDTPTVNLDPLNVTVTDTLVVTDTPTVVRELVAVVSDTLVVTDTPPTVERESGAAPPAEVTKTDTLALSDDLGYYSETVWFSDYVAVSVEGGAPDFYEIDTSDTLVTTDTADVKRQIVVDTSDTLVVTDATDVKRQIVVSASDTISYTDASTVELHPLNVAVSDRVVVTDTPTVNSGDVATTVADTLTLGDAATVQYNPLIIHLPASDVMKDWVSVSDAVTVTIPELTIVKVDTLVVDMDKLYIATDVARIVASTLVVTDTRVVERSGDALASVSDTLVTTDAVTVTTSEFIIVASDTVTLSDATQVQRDIRFAEIDYVYLSSSVTVVRELARSVSDTLVVTDTRTVVRELAIVKTDTLVVTDTASVQRQIVIATDDSLTLSDEVTVRLYPAVISRTDTVTVSETVVVEKTRGTFWIRELVDEVPSWSTPANADALTVVTLDAQTTAEGVVIREEYPDTNYASGSTFAVGNTRGYIVRAAALGFPITGLTRPIVGATLRLYQVLSHGSGSSTVYVYRAIKATLESTVTWNTPWTSPGGNFTQDLELIGQQTILAYPLFDWSYISIPLDADEIEKIRDGTYVNRGFFIRSSTEGTYGYDQSFYDANQTYPPLLVIEHPWSEADVDTTTWTERPMDMDDGTIGDEE